MFEIKQGTVTFKSNAPLENINAESAMLTGLVSLDQNTFAFSVDVNSFKGFNSALQQEHFYENYMETDVYPRATFSGKLIDKFNPDLQTQKIRAKGNLDIHGVKKERIIDVVITKKGDHYLIVSDFNVLLADHNIRIPKVVYQKIAENINIKVQGEMVRK
jgi:polyisoprenoid-binding protein YceI